MTVKRPDQLDQLLESQIMIHYTNLAEVICDLSDLESELNYLANTFVMDFLDLHANVDKQTRDMLGIAVEQSTLIRQQKLLRSASSCWGRLYGIFHSMESMIRFEHSQNRTGGHGIRK